MRAYLDSSVVLRWVFRAPDPFRPPVELEKFAASVILRVECLRAIDRTRIVGDLTAEETAERIGNLHAHIRNWTLLPVTDDILDTAAAHLPVAVATLDAIHIASALHLKKTILDTLVFVTHDRTQATAARVLGLEVIGESTESKTP